MSIQNLEADAQRTGDFLAAVPAFKDLPEKLQIQVVQLLTGQEAGEDSVPMLKEKLEKTIGFLDNRKAQVEELKPFQRRINRIEGPAQRALADAITHMWGGYSQSGSSKLQELAECPYMLPDLRARACYELARFYADNGRYFTAANMMSDARNLSKTYMRGTRQRVLEYEMLLETDDMDTALRRIQEYIKFRERDPNFYIGMANYYYKMDDLDRQIGVINDLFTGRGIASVRVDDPNEPFLSLTSAEPLLPVTEGPKVSVLMSCHNSAEYLKLAVGCMQKQTWQNLEIIITDDCSTDNSLAMLNEMAAEDPRLIIISNTENCGTYGNRNRMLEICTGEYVTVHDSDDWSHPQMIDHQMQNLMDNPDVRLNTTLMCRVSQALKFHLRPSRASLEYCHMNYPGFLMRTEDVKALGGWDPIMANADAEFERRVKKVHGKEAFAIVNPDTTYSFFLVHENSLTQRKLMNLRSLTFGSRNEYHRQSEFWMSQRSAEAEKKDQTLEPFVLTGRPSRQEPFPSPNGLLVPRLKREVLEYDILIVSDMFLLGGTRSCNINYVKMLHAMGKRVAMFNWPRGDLRYATDIHPNYRQLAQDGLIEIVTWEDKIKAKSVIVHHPPLANMELDKYPTVETDRVSVLINQLPFQTTERERHFYQPSEVTTRLKRIFGTDVVEWIAISPLTLQYISEYADEITVLDQIWYPPIFVEPELITMTPAERFARMQENGATFARHCRDHWTKWPNSGDRTVKMYMAEANHRFSILGGGKTLGRRLSGNLPENWEVHAYDGISVPDMLNNSDIYLNFNNEIYIEEFGRNVMEAMLFGLPVITEPVFAKTFGKAVLIAGRDGPAELVERLTTDQAFFEERVALGQAFVEEHCATTNVAKKLEVYFQ